MLSFSLQKDSVHSGISLQKGAFNVRYGFIEFSRAEVEYRSNLGIGNIPNVPEFKFKMISHVESCVIVTVYAIQRAIFPFVNRVCIRM